MGTKGHFPHFFAKGWRAHPKGMCLQICLVHRNNVFVLMISAKTELWSCQYRVCRLSSVICFQFSFTYTSSTSYQSAAASFGSSLPTGMLAYSVWSYYERWHYFSKLELENKISGSSVEEPPYIVRNSGFCFIDSWKTFYTMLNLFKSLVPYIYSIMHLCYNKKVSKANKSRTLLRYSIT